MYSLNWNLFSIRFKGFIRRSVNNTITPNYHISNKYSYSILYASASTNFVRRIFSKLLLCDKVQTIRWAWKRKINIIIIIIKTDTHQVNKHWWLVCQLQHLCDFLQNSYFIFVILIFFFVDTNITLTISL